MNYDVEIGFCLVSISSSYIFLSSINISVGNIRLVADMISIGLLIIIEGFFKECAPAF